MQYYFKEENTLKLKKVCEKWQGTKYRHMGSNSGGMDCTKLLGVVLKELGILEQYEENVYYPRDWFLHSEKELVIETFINHSKYLTYDLCFEKFIIKTGNFDYKNGDIILFKVCGSQRINHVGIYLDDNLFHADVRSGVCFVQFLRYFRTRAKYVYRISYKNI